MCGTAGVPWTDRADPSETELTPPDYRYYGTLGSTGGGMVVTVLSRALPVVSLNAGSRIHDVTIDKLMNSYCSF